MVEQGELSVQVVPAEQVDLTDEGHQVSPIEQVGLMAAEGQVVPDKQVDLEQHHKRALAVQYLD